MPMSETPLAERIARVLAGAAGFVGGSAGTDAVLYLVEGDDGPA